MPSTFGTDAQADKVARRASAIDTGTSLAVVVLPRHAGWILVDEIRPLSNGLRA
jgi:hypothetical protein